MIAARSRVLALCAVLLVLGLVAPATLADQAPDQDGLQILSYPVGLVVGRLDVRVELGDTGQGAELLLDGTRVCTVPPGGHGCTVDIGPDPHVHLLELVRRDSLGSVVEKAERWLNWPGQESGLELRVLPADGRTCSARLSWVHPDRLDPASIEVLLGDEHLDLERDGHTVEYRCRDAAEAQVLVASAVFPDGRRAEAVAVLSGFSGETGRDLIAYPLVSTEPRQCKPGAAGWPAAAERVEEGAFEAVVVLDPTAGYNTLLTSGWFPGRIEGSQSVTTKMFDTLVHSADSAGGPRARPSWSRAERTLFDGERIWFVLPDSRLTRVNGFGEGRSEWLKLLFKVGQSKITGGLRIADAVAASGLVAGAGPRRRIVILLLGDGTGRDQSLLSTTQARAFLREIGVPLVVMRNGRLRDDGWPAGLPARNMESMAEALEAVQKQLERQCIAWFTGTPSPAKLLASLPEDVHLAGLAPDAGIDGTEAWARTGETVAPASTRNAQGETQGSVEAGQTGFSGRMEVTATALLISATDAEGQPVTDLEASQLDVAEDGFPVQVVSLEPIPTASSGETTPAGDNEAGTTAPAEPARPQARKDEGLPIAIYVEKDLAGSLALSPALEALAEESGRLVASGNVEVIVADETVTTALAPTRQADDVAAALKELAAGAGGRGRVELIRQRFIRDIRGLPARISKGQAQQLEASGQVLGAGDTPDRGLESSVRITERGVVKNAARAHAAEEEALLRRSMERLRSWALSSPVTGPRLLMIVGAAFDEDPMLFYLPFVEKEEPQHAAQLRLDLKDRRQSDRLEDLAVDLAAARWRVLTIAGHTTASLAIGADQDLGERFQAFMSASPETIRTSDPGWLMLDVAATQRRLAEPSGGTLVVGASELRAELDRMRGWYRLTYQIDRPPDGALHRIDVLPRRSGIKLRLPEQIASETTEGQATARLLRLLISGATTTGDLTTSATVEATSVSDGRRTGTLEVVTGLEPVAGIAARQGQLLLRVSVAVEIPDAAPFVLHRTERLDAGSSGLRYSVPLEWPETARRLVVTVEEITSGAWGSAIVSLPR